MADRELEIVVRARDQLTAELKRMGASLGAISGAGRAAFAAIDTVAKSAAKSVASLATGLGVVAKSVAGLNSSSIKALEAAIASSTAQLQRMQAAAAADAQALGALGAAGGVFAKEIALLNVGKFDAIKQSIVDMTTQLGVAKAALEGLRASDSVGKNLPQQINNAQEAVRRLGLSGASLRPLEQEIAAAKDRLEAMRVAATNARGAVSQLDRINILKLSNEIRQAEAALQRLGRVASPGVVNAAQGATASLANVGAVGVRAGNETSASFARMGQTLRTALIPILPIATATGAAFAAMRAVGNFSDFSKSMAQVATVTDTTKFSVESLRGVVLRLAKTFGKNEVDLARGLFFAISSGARNAAEGVEILTAATRLSVIGPASTENTVDLLTTALNSYANQNLRSAEAADVLFNAVKVGKGRIEDLALSFGRAIPLGAALGISFTELNGFLAALSLSMGSTDQATTALRNILFELLQVSSEDRASLKALGADIDPVSIQANGLTKTILGLNAAFAGDSDKLKEIFPDIRGLVGVLALVNDGGEKLNRVLAEVAKSSGSVGRGLEVFLTEPANQLSIAMNDLRISFANAFGGAFFSALQDATKNMGGLAGATKLVSEGAANIGASFGAAFPAILNGIRIVSIGLAGAVRLVELLNPKLLALAAARAILGSEAEAIKEVGRAITGVQATLDSVESRRISGGSIFLNKEEVAALNEVIENVPGDIDKISRFRSTIADVHRLLDQLNAREAKIHVIFDKSESDKIIDNLAELKKQLVGGADPKQAPKLARPIEEVKRALDEAEDKLKLFKLALSSAGSAKDRDSGDILSIRKTVEELLNVKEAAGKAEIQVASLRAEYAQLVQVNVESLEKEILSLEDALASSEEIASLLGLSLGKIGEGGLKQKIAQLKDEVAGLKKSLLELRGQTDQPPKIAVAPAVDPAAVTKQLEKSIKRAQEAAARGNLAITLGLKFNITDAELAEAASAAQLAADTASAEVARIGLVRQAIRLNVSLNTKTLEADITRAREQLQLFADSLNTVADERERLTGQAIALGVTLLDVPVDQLQIAIEHAQTKVEKGNLAIQLGLDLNVDDQTLARVSETARVAAERAQAEIARVRLIRQAIRLNVSLDTETLEADVAHALELVQIFSDSLNTAEAERQRLFGQAVALGVHILDLPPDAIRVAIEHAQAAADEGNLAISLGLKISVAPAEIHRVAEKAALAVEEALSKVGRAGTEREAIRFGIDIHSETLEADIIRARDEAQAFADGLADRGVERAAIALHISIDGKAPEQLKKEIALAREEAEKFSAEHPLLLQGIDLAASGLADAFVDIASGTKSASEAFREFAASFLRQIAQMIVQAAILKALQTAFGVPPGLAQGGIFGVARGAVINGDMPGMAEVHAYAAGGLHNRVTTRPTVAPMALFGEAGPEAIMPVRARGGGYAVDVVGGGEARIGRGQGGRLGVQRFETGSVFGRQAATAGGGAAVSVGMSFNIAVQRRDEGQRVESALSDPRLREQIESLVVEKLNSSAGYRAQIRGDRV